MCVYVKLLQDLSVSGVLTILLLITGPIMSVYAKDWNDLAKVSGVFKDKINKVATSLEAASVSVYMCMLLCHRNPFSVYTQNLEHVFSWVVLSSCSNIVYLMCMHT